MHKVIVEKPRANRGLDYKNIRRSDSEFNGLSKVSMKKPYGYDRREQTDVLGPLKKFLKSKIGQPWNDVWSEVCKVNDNRSVIGSHVRDHIRWMVEFNIVKCEDGLYSYYGRYSRFPLKNSFYVDQKGILCYTGSTKYKRYKPKKKIINLNGLYFYKHEGIWYKVEICHMPKNNNNSFWPGKDAFGYYLDNVGYPTDCKSVYGEAVYVVSKKQIGKRMIKILEKFINEKS
jgi:hypothetical protein